MKAHIFLATAALLLFAGLTPVYAAEDDNNSGFGEDMFAGKGHPAFEDPDFFDIDSLTNIAPAAGDEAQNPAPADQESGDPAQKPDATQPGTGGMSSTILKN